MLMGRITPIGNGCMQYKPMPDASGLSANFPQQLHPCADEAVAYRR